MADILIRGMEMPTRCGLCPMFCDDFNDYCSAAQRSIPFDAEKPEWCPFVPLPAGHGRLIDADAAAKEAYRSLLECEKYGNEFQKPYEIIRAIETAKTIVPAEGGTDNGN